MTTADRSIDGGVDRETVWLTTAALLLVWIVLAVFAVAAPWFVIFAALAWLLLPLGVVVVAGVVGTGRRLRPQARSVARGAWYALGIEVLPSIVVIFVAASQMSSDYF